MYKILDNLVTHGLGQPGLLKGYSECKQGLIDKFRIASFLFSDFPLVIH
jgi:hypothetical protein